MGATGQGLDFNNSNAYAAQSSCPLAAGFPIDQNDTLIKSNNMGLFSKRNLSKEEDVHRLKVKIASLSKELDYNPKVNGDVIMIEASNGQLEIADNIFIEPNTRFNNGEIVKNNILFCGMGIPFDANSTEELTAALALMRANTNSYAVGYWGIDRQGDKDYINYFVDVYEDGLNKETFVATVQTILSAKKNIQKLIANNTLIL